MRNNSVLDRVLYVAHDAKCFFLFCRVYTCIFLDNYLTTLFHYKMPTYGSCEYKEEGSGTGPNRKQGLVETDSSVIINFDML